jgi:hypothetical protein
MAAIIWKLAGKVSEPCDRLMVTILSSIGWRITSRTRGPNSGSSSRNKRKYLYLPESRSDKAAVQRKPAPEIPWCGFSYAYWLMVLHSERIEPLRYMIHNLWDGRLA